MFEEILAAFGITEKIYFAGKNIWNKLKRAESSYYFHELNKKVFVQDNGDGLIINSFTIVFYNFKKKDFYRSIDISDAKINVVFPTLEVMQNPDNKYFSNFGFWIKSENGIVRKVTESYDIPLFPNPNTAANNPKLLGLQFSVDCSKIEFRRPYRVVYGISIPGMYPIIDGKFDSINAIGGSKELFTSVEVKRLSGALKTSFYFDNKIVLDTAPMCKLILRDNKKQDKFGSDEYNILPSETKDNLFYTKYVFSVKHPERYSYIGLKAILK